MAEKTPVRVNYDGNGNAIGFAELQSTEFIGIDDGGTGAITASGARTALGLSIGTDIQAYDTDLATIAGLSHTDGAFIVSNGSAWTVESGATARASLGLGSSDNPTFNGVNLSILALDSVNVSTIVTSTETFTSNDNDTSLPTTASVIDYVTAQVETANELSELTDVTFGTLSTGDIIRYDGSAWVNEPLNLGTDTEGDYVESITAGSGLGIDISSGEQQTPTLSVNVDDSSIEISSDTLQVKASGITNAMLSNDSVTINTNSLSLGGSLTLDTDDIGEGSTNLYYTNARFDTQLSTKDTDDLTEGSTNLYYTTSRQNTDFDTRLATKDTDNLSEGSTNLYFTNARVDTEIDSYLSGGTGVTVSSGEISIGQAVSTSSDVTFNDLIVSGDLTVSGTTTTVNTETINLADNTITLNSNATGSATEDGGIEIERGDDTNVTLLWDESNDRWTVGSYDFVASTFIGNLTGNVTGTVSDVSNHNTDDIAEGSTNLYYTSTRANTDFDTKLAAADTDDLSEGTTNLYYTDTRARNSLSVASGSGLSYNSSTGEFGTSSIPNAQLANSSISFTDGTTSTSTALGGTVTFTGGTGVTIANTSGNFDFSFDISEVKSDIDEYAQDAINDAFTAGTQTRITVSYDDASNSISYTVDDDLANYDNTNTNFITLTGISATTNTGVTYDNTTGVIALASIPNSSLTNSSMTIAGNSVSLGGTLSLDTADITESTNLYYTDTRFDTRLATKDTDDLTEGSSNLYYTDARFDTQLATKDTDDVSEGSTNLYYTDARVENYITGGTGIDFSSGTISIEGTVVTESSTDTLTNKTINFEDNTAIVEFAVTVANVSGNKYHLDGETSASIQLIPGITYIFDQSDSSNGGHPLVLSTTKDGTHGSGSNYTTGVTTNGTPGTSGAYTQIVVNAATADTLYYYCSAHSGMGGDSVISVQGVSLTNSDTDGLSEGSSNLYFTDTRARSAISVTDNGGDGSLSYNSSNGVITYTGPSASEVRAHFSAGTGVTYNNGTGVIAIGQDVATSANVTFQSIEVGDLTVTGTETIINTVRLSVNDPLIHLADSNETSDDLDIGIIGHYSPDAGVTRQHTGFFRDASNGEYYVFATYIDSDLDSTGPTATNLIDRTDPTFSLAGFNAATLSGQYLGFDSDLGTKSLDDIAEGSTKLFYTSERADSDARNAISVTSATGLSYTPATGVLAGVTATTSGTKGVAAFNANDFAINSGVVSILALSNAQLDNSSVTIGTDVINLGDTRTDLNGL